MPKNKRKRKRPAVILVESGPYHNYHICKNNNCRSLVQVNYRVTHFIPQYVSGETLYDPDGRYETIYSGNCDVTGYKCPKCGKVNALWQHLGEYTSDDLISRQQTSN